MIFKLQRAIVSSEDQPPVLAYNEDRSALGQFPATPEMLELFGDEYKIYVDAELSEDGQLEVVEVVEEQDW